MTNKYKNVYLNEVSTVTGPYEKDGPLSKLFDRSYNDMYMLEDSFEKAEIHMMKESVDILYDKLKVKDRKTDLFIAGDLQNQIGSSSHTALFTNAPFIGIYSACASNVEGMIIGSNLIENKNINNCIVSVSSHNMVSERQFRNPTEYGAPKPNSATFTATGGASAYLSNKKSNIKIESSTLGRVIDMNQTDPNNMGAVMSIAAADTINRHLKDLGRDANYYDLIVTGDLGILGKEILIDYMKSKYKIDISNNYNDCGVMLYDLENQKEVQAGGSGPVCSALVMYSDILNKMKKDIFYIVLA